MDTENQLIVLLPRADRKRLLGLSEAVEMTMTETLFEVGKRTRHVYFPTEGYVSLLSAVDDDSIVEVGMVGREGMLGIHVVLGSPRAPLVALIQREGRAWRVPVAAFKRELASSGALRHVLQRYIAVLMTQLASSAACVRYHAIAPRLARWLLMSHDRSGSDRFFMTQEMLSSMLGVRRVGVTTAASAMQEQGLIDYRRGHIHVIDRPGLEAAACSCYASDQRAYETLSG